MDTGSLFQLLGCYLFPKEGAVNGTARPAGRGTREAHPPPAGPSRRSGAHNNRRRRGQRAPRRRRIRLAFPAGVPGWRSLPHAEGRRDMSRPDVPPWSPALAAQATGFGEEQPGRPTPPPTGALPSLQRAVAERSLQKAQLRPWAGSEPGAEGCRPPVRGHLCLSRTLWNLRTQSPEAQGRLKVTLLPANVTRMEGGFPLSAGDFLYCDLQV